MGIFGLDSLLNFNLLPLGFRHNITFQLPLDQTSYAKITWLACSWNWDQTFKVHKGEPIFVTFHYCYKTLIICHHLITKYLMVWNQPQSNSSIFQSILLTLGMTPLGFDHWSVSDILVQILLPFLNLSMTNSVQHMPLVNGFQMHTLNNGQWQPLKVGYWGRWCFLQPPHMLPCPLQQYCQMVVI